MSDSSRALPDHPNLRYLKIEAKRRLAAGEFTSLHDAQLTIAREHGMSSWAALKTTVVNPVLSHLRWLVGRFSETDGWVAPDEDELRAHFAERYLSLVPPELLIRTVRLVAPAFHGKLVVVEETVGTVRARIGEVRVDAMVEPGLPYRLARLSWYRP